MTQIETNNIAETQQKEAAANEPGYVVGVDLGGTNLRLAIANMAGTPLTKWTGSTVGLCGPDAVIGLISYGVKELLTEVGASHDALRSIAIGVPGIADADKGIVIATSYLMGWQDVCLRACLEQKLKIPIAVDNDVNLAAIGESWAGAAKDVRDFVFLAIGTGIGAGIVLDGRLYRGNSWSAGEIGYMLVPGTTAGPRTGDEPGALESMIGGEGIKSQWQTLWCPDKTALPRELKATEIFDRALEGEPLAQMVLDQSATMLAQAIYNIWLVLNCPLFVLGGSIGMHPSLCDALRKRLDEWMGRDRLRLVRSKLGTDAQLMGAIRFALETANARGGSQIVSAGTH